MFLRTRRNRARGRRRYRVHILSSPSSSFTRHSSLHRVVPVRRLSHGHVEIPFHPLQKLQVIQRPRFAQLFYFNILRNLQLIEHGLQHLIILHVLVLCSGLEGNLVHRNDVWMRGVHDLTINRPRGALFDFLNFHPQQSVHPQDELVSSDEKRRVHHSYSRHYYYYTSRQKRKWFSLLLSF